LLAATGKDGLTDAAIKAALPPVPVEITWQPDKELPCHPNGLEFEALDGAGYPLAALRAYSPGVGASLITPDSGGPFQSLP
jgi:L-serine dehydratase